ncbi:AAA family ATPase [Oxalobacteraceae sp. CFBP 8763]|nr:AAA family ATPase [Oxalobacteraceae sp. CFBP 8763]
MKLTLLGWESTGLRCPDMIIDLTNKGKVPKVSLVQMPNGTGKTTTLDLIMAALTGKADEWPSSKIRKFRRAGETNDSGKFVLRLIIDEDPLTFELAFDFLEERISYRTTFRSGGGIKTGWVPPTEVKRFLKDKFVRLFIFDGELAQGLLDGSKTKASDAIDTLCQLEHLDEILKVTDADWQLITRNQGAKTVAGLASWQSREKRLSDRLIEVRGIRETLASENERLSRSIEELNAQLNGNLQTDKRSQERKERLEVLIRQAEDKIASQSKAALQLVRQPQFLSPQFAGGIGTLKDQFDRVRLPESTSKQFFVELAEEANCICGRPIGAHEQVSILAKSLQYLANEQYSFINSLKSDIKQFVTDEIVARESCIETILNELRLTRRSLSELRTEHEEIHLESIANSNDTSKSLAAELETLNKELDETNMLLEKIDEHPEDDISEGSWSLRGLESEVNRIRKQIAQITGTVELKMRRDVIFSIVEKTKASARQRLRTSVREACNDRLNTVLSGDPLRIESIHNCLSLHEQDGASVGQTLAVGYTFLSTLLARGAHKFPLVVDSPSGSLDDHVRKQVGRMIPSLCDQFVAFTISTEREHFLPALEEVVGDSIEYLTVFRTTPGMQQMLEGMPENSLRTSDGVVVRGRDYFINFVIREEQG